MLDELYEKVNELYDAIDSISELSKSSSYKNETEIFINNAYRNAIAKICNISERDVTYGMIDLAKNYIVYEEKDGYKRGRHLSNQELIREVNNILGINESKKEEPQDRIGKLYEIISDNITTIRELGFPEDEVFNYMNELTTDIYKNTISDITDINPDLIPNEFVYNIACCTKYKDGKLVVEKYTDPEIVIAAKESGLYDRKPFIFPGEYNHHLAGKIERLDYACVDHLETLNKLGVKHDEVKAFMNHLTQDLYKETLADILDVSIDEVDDDLVESIRKGKRALDGSRKSYLDNEIKLLYAYNKSKNKTI